MLLSLDSLDSDTVEAEVVAIQCGRVSCLRRDDPWRAKQVRTYELNSIMYISVIIEFAKCYANAETPQDCVTQKEDYLECLFHTKEVRQRVSISRRPAGNPTDSFQMHRIS